MIKPTLVSVLSLAVLLGSASRALADKGASGEITHRVSEKGETYEDLADFYYGKRWLSLHLRIFNRRPEPLAKGSTILIPTFSLRSVKRLQTLQQFAEQSLADPERADYLAELHHLSEKDRITPKPGTRLKVVTSLRHVVRPGETLKSIATTYYRDGSKDRMRLIILYNKLSSAIVKPGQGLRIPLDLPEFNQETVLARSKKTFERTMVAEVEKEAATKAATPPPPELEAKRVMVRKRVRPHVDRELRERDKDKDRSSGVAPPAEEEQELPRGDSPAQEVEHEKASASRIDDEIETLERSCSDGEYKSCEERAKKLVAMLPVGAFSGRVEILRLRAFALVALGRVEESKETFRNLLKLDPEYDLDLYRTSPKILDVFQAVAER
jgi:LysM repeat protein